MILDIVLTVCVSGVFAIIAILNDRERQRSADERERLTRLAVADTQVERIAALQPVRSAKKVEDPDRPKQSVKPIGI